MKNKFVLFVFGLFSAFFFFTNSYASTTLDFSATGGSDASTGSARSFIASDIAKLATSDDSRIQSNGPWPNTGAYDENKYIEFAFTPNIPSDAMVTNVAITHEFRRSGTLAAAKLEVWDGAHFVDQALTVGSNVNVDHTDTINVSSLINTPAQVNALKARFLAYRRGSATTTTSHD